MINQSWLWRCFPSFFSLPHFPFCLLRTRSAKLHRGPVRKTRRTKSRPETAEDHPFAEVRRNTNAARAAGRETGGGGRAARDYKGSAPTSKAAIAGRSGRELKDGAEVSDRCCSLFAM